MAFETIATWQVERQLFAPLPTFKWSPSIPEHIPFQKQWEKAPSALLAVGLNAALFYYLATSAFDQDIDLAAARGAIVEASMTILDIGADSEDVPTPEAAAGGSGDRDSGQNNPQEFDLTAQTELPPEWSVASVRVRRIVENAQTKHVGIGDQSANDVGTGSDQGVYDPYAGAGPNRKADQAWANKRSKLGGATKAVDGIDQTAFTRWVQSLHQKLPRATGTVELKVTIGSDQTIATAELVGGTASLPVKLFVRNAVIGRRLSDDQRRELRLPVVDFG